MTLSQQQPGFDSQIWFVPVRGDFARGIFAMVTVDTDRTAEEIAKLYSDFYASAAFTHYTDANIDLKQVVNTNKALIHIIRHEGKLLIISAIDNLLKGASGQAVQNMNLMFGLPETMGLQLKPSAF